MPIIALVRPRPDRDRAHRWAMSSARPITRDALIPGANSSSYRVTTGPSRTCTICHAPEIQHRFEHAGVLSSASSSIVAVLVAGGRPVVERRGLAIVEISAVVVRRGGRLGGLPAA